MRYTNDARSIFSVGAGVEVFLSLYKVVFGTERNGHKSLVRKRKMIFWGQKSAVARFFCSVS